MGIIISFLTIFLTIFKLVGRSNEIKHKRDLLLHKNAMSLPIPTPTSPKKKIYSFVGEIKRETMSNNCKPMERHMLVELVGKVSGDKWKFGWILKGWKRFGKANPFCTSRFYTAFT